MEEGGPALNVSVTILHSRNLDVCGEVGGDRDRETQRDPFKMLCHALPNLITEISKTLTKPFLKD